MASEVSSKTLFISIFKRDSQRQSALFSFLSTKLELTIGTSSLMMQDEKAALDISDLISISWKPDCSVLQHFGLEVISYKQQITGQRIT